MIDTKKTILQMTGEEFVEVCEICTAANAKLADIKSLTAFICALGIIIDQWQADTEADPDEVQKAVNQTGQLPAESHGTARTVHQKRIRGGNA